MEEQTKFSFDNETVKKIVRGTIHAAAVAAALGVLDYFANMAGNIHTDNIFGTMFLVWFSGTGYNAVRQYIKGQ